MKKKSRKSALTVTVPAPYIRSIQCAAVKLGIPASAAAGMIRKELAGVFHSHSTFEPFAVYVFPNRASAKRAADRYFAVYPGCPDVDVWFKRGGKEQRATFTNRKSPNVCIAPENIALVSLTADELRRVCEDLASELQHDGGPMISLPSEDFTGILHGWRKFSPRFVKDAELYSNERGRPFDPEIEENTRRRHDEGADLLEKLLRYLPRKSVAASA